MTKQTIELDLKWWTVRQNNSGGYWITDDDVAMFVMIQAPSIQEAEAIFDRVTAHALEYCSCCGERWYFSDYEKGTDDPMIYGKPYKEYRENKWFASEAEARLHYYHGPVASYKFNAPVEPEIEDNSGAPGTNGYFSMRD
jgi:hypothetical protein